MITRATVPAVYHRDKFVPPTFYQGYTCSAARTLPTLPLANREDIPLQPATHHSAHKNPIHNPAIRSPPHKTHHPRLQSPNPAASTPQSATPPLSVLSLLPLPSRLTPLPKVPYMHGSFPIPCFTMENQRCRLTFPLFYHNPRLCPKRFQQLAYFLAYSHPIQCEGSIQIV